MFNSMKYTAYLASEEILECDNFKTIFKAARYRVRDNGYAAIIKRNSDNKTVAVQVYMFNKFFTFKEINSNQRGLIKAVFDQNDAGYMLKYF